MANHQHNTVTPNGIDDARAVVQVYGHGLLDQYGLARRRRNLGMLCMELVRRRNVYGFHPGIPAQLLDVRVGSPAEVLLEFAARAWPRVGGGNQAHTLVAPERGQHQRKRAPQPHHSQTDRFFVCHLVLAKKTALIMERFYRPCSLPRYFGGIRIRTRRVAMLHVGIALLLDI